MNVIASKFFEDGFHIHGLRCVGKIFPSVEMLYNMTACRFEFCRMKLCGNFCTQTKTFPIFHFNSEKKMTEKFIALAKRMLTRVKKTKPYVKYNFISR